MKFVPVLDTVCIGALTVAGYLYWSSGAYVTDFDENTSLILLAVSILAGALRTAIAYQDFRRRGL